MSQWNKGYWKVGDAIEHGARPIYAYGCTVAICQRASIFSDSYTRNPEANAQRIVACVNALDGLNPAAIGQVVEALEVALDTLEHGVQSVATSNTIPMIKAALQALQPGEREA